MRPCPSPRSTTMDYFNLTDASYERRRDELFRAVVEHMGNRGALVRAKASLRTFRDTTSIDMGDSAAYLFVTGGKVAIGVLVVPALVAGTVLSGGTLPVAAVVAGGFAMAMTRLIGTVRHSMTVGTILAAVKSHLDTPADIELTPANLALGRNMLQKLISDSDKLDREITRAQAELRRLGTPVASKADFIRDLLNAETTGAVDVFPIDTRMSRVGRDGRKIVLHRLRRIRGYLVWLLRLTSQLKGHALAGVGTARALEADVVDFVTQQVHATGNHANCASTLCFGPGPADVRQAPTTTPPSSVSAIAERYATLTPSTFETQRERVRIAESSGFTGEEQAIGQIAARLEGELDPAYEALEEALVDALGETAGTLASELVGEFGGDLISGALERARTSYRVNRPLLARVRLVQQALSEKSGVELDRDIAAQAGRNDLKALLRAYDKVTLHYPARVDQRVQKLERLMVTVRARAARVRRPDGRLWMSPLYNCTAATTLARHLVKVYHYSEKQLIHAQFVNFGLDAVARKVFGVGADLATGPRRPFTGADLNEARRNLRSSGPPVQRPRVDALGIALAAGRRNLRPTETREVDPMAGIRQAERAADDLDFGILSATWITNEGLLNPMGARRSAPLLTVQQWQRSSRIMGFRTDLTRTTDTALGHYAQVAGRLMAPTVASDGRSNRVTTARLSSALAEVDARLRVLQGEFKPALDGWLAAKSDKDKSKRRDSILRLSMLVAREIDDLDRLKRQVQGAQRIRATAGVAPIPEWLLRPIEIEAEPDE